MSVLIASLACLVASFGPLASVVLAVAIAGVIVCAVTGEWSSPFAVSVDVLMHETADETDFFGDDPIGADVLASNRAEADERAPLLPCAPTVERFAVSFYPATIVRAPVYEIDAGPAWGRFYVCARTFHDAAAALQAEFERMDLDAPIPDADWKVRERKHAPWNAPLIVAPDA